MGDMTTVGKNRKASGLKNNSRPDRGKNRKHGMIEVLTVAQERERLAKQYRIKHKTKLVIDELMDNPQLTHAQAYMKHHSTTNKNTASTAVTKLLKKPSVIGYQASAVGKAKRRVIELVDSKNESVALKASESIIDRTEGKAVQKTENLTRTLEVKLDLSGVRIGAHHVQALPEQE